LTKQKQSVKLRYNQEKERTNQMSALQAMTKTVRKQNKSHSNISETDLGILINQALQVAHFRMDAGDNLTYYSHHKQVEIFKMSEHGNIDITIYDEFGYEIYSSVMW